MIIIIRYAKILECFILGRSLPYRKKVFKIERSSLNWKRVLEIRGTLPNCKSTLRNKRNLYNKEEVCQAQNIFEKICTQF